MPRRIRHRRVAQCDSTVPREQPSHIKGCGTPVATAPSRTMSRLQPPVATHWEILLRPCVSEGRNTMLRRGWYASPVSESVHGRLGFSRVIEEQSEGYHHGGEELLAPSRAVSINRTTTETRVAFHLFRLLRLLRLTAILPSEQRGAHP